MFLVWLKTLKDWRSLSVVEAQFVVFGFFLLYMQNSWLKQNTEVEKADSEQIMRCGEKKTVLPFIWMGEMDCFMHPVLRFASELQYMLQCSTTEEFLFWFVYVWLCNTEDEWRDVARKPRTAITTYLLQYLI